MSGSAARPATFPDGILVVDKPARASSFDVIRRLKPALGKRKTGFLGTLDPFATGVLPLCIGEATKLADALAGAEKEYVAELTLGAGTDSGDLTGRITHTAPVPELAESALAALCERFRGEIEQVPPMHSAIHVDGERLYAKARRGEVVERASRRVTIHQLAIRVLAADRLAIHVVCSTGTYVRVLAEDIARALGTEGHLLTLRRTRSGGFDVEHSASIDAILTNPAPAFARALVPIDHVCLPGFVDVALDPAGAAAVQHGAAVRAESLPESTRALPLGTRVALRHEGRLLALGLACDDAHAPIRPSRVLVRADRAG